MKTKTSKVLTCLLSLVLLFSTFGVSVNAAQIRPRAIVPGDTYINLFPVNGDYSAYIFLNISTYDMPYNNANVNLYTPTGHQTQLWIMSQGGNEGWWQLRSARDDRYALNVWRGASNNYNCDVYTWSNNLKDSAVASLNYGQSDYVIELQNYSGYELSTGSTSGWYSGQNVKWINYAYANHYWAR